MLGWSSDLFVAVYVLVQGLSYFTAFMTVEPEVVPVNRLVCFPTTGWFDIQSRAHWSRTDAVHRRPVVWASTVALMLLAMSYIVF